MTDREKLIELLEAIPHAQRLYPDMYVDKLIENGVIIQKRSKWISEVELRPELYGWVPLNNVVCMECGNSNTLEKNYCPDCGSIMNLE